MSSTVRGRRGTKCGTCVNCRKKRKCINTYYNKTSCFVYIFFIWLWCGALTLRFIWQTRKSIVGDTCDISVPRDSSVKITPKPPANFASLNSSIAFGDLRLGGCLRAPGPQAPARAQSPARNTRIKRRKIREDFVGYFGIRESEVYTSEFTVRALYNINNNNIIL